MIHVLFSVSIITKPTDDIHDPNTLEIALITEIRGIAKTTAAAKQGKRAKDDVSNISYFIVIYS
jgi:hypothetical protein